MLAVSHLTCDLRTQQIVRAMIETGQETRLFTTLTPDGSDLAARALRLVSAGGSRALTEIPNSVAVTYPWRELARVVVRNACRNETFNDRVFHWARDGFDAWVAEQMKAPCRLIYGFETECLETFRAARARGIRTVYDLPAAEHGFVENMLRQEYERFPELRTPARHRFEELENARTARRHEEFRLADRVCANSQFTRDTWVAAGLDATKIITLSLGAPKPDPTGVDGGSHGQGPLRLVWAGNFALHKGAHYLLAAWRDWAACRQARLDVYGSVNLPASFKAQPLPGITFQGRVSRAQLLAAFKQADALIFPTLSDGFGMVVTEALSCGLPVITTRRAGASDLIRTGHNGLLIEHASTEALTTAFDWCAGHRAGLRAMRAAALDTAAGWQWEHYRQALREQVLQPPIQDQQAHP